MAACFALLMAWLAGACSGGRLGGPALPWRQAARAAATLPVSAAPDVAGDVAALEQKLAAHPGDGEVRGPDQLVYNLAVRLDPVQHQFQGRLSVHLHNNLGRPLDQLYFNVWANAPHYRRAGGSEQVAQVMFNGQPAKAHLQGTVLVVTLSQPLAPGACGTVTMNFQSVLPHIADRFGWYRTTLSLGNWYPVLAVHDNNGWVTPPFFTDGESFYSLTAVYHVAVDAPKGLLVAVSGEPETAVVNQGDRTVYRYRAMAVRDVALVADSRYRVLQAQAGHTAVYVYYTPEQAAQSRLMLDVAKQALTSFSQHYGPYPYPTLRVCAMNGWFGGMEYPELVMVSFLGGNSPDETKADVAHEVAHQWFYGLVGDDEYLTPWLDESFATFAEQRFDKTLAGWEESWVRDDVSNPVSAFPNSDFPGQSGNADSPRYYDAVYDKGAAVLNDLMNLLGEARFDAMMQSYVQRFEYRVVTTTDFIQAASAAAGRDLTGYFSTRGINPRDAWSAPQMPWVRTETQENGCGWHVTP